MRSNTYRQLFLLGQKLEQEVHHVVQNNDIDKTSIVERYRKYIGFLIPMCFMQTVWWTLAIRYNIFRLYPTRYELPITMILGATVAGERFGLLMDCDCRTANTVRFYWILYWLYDWFIDLMKKKQRYAILTRLRDAYMHIRVLCNTESAQ